MRIYLVTIGSLALASTALILHIVNNYDPEIASNSIFIYLFLLLSLFLTSVLSLLLFWLKINFIDRSRIVSSLGLTTRQSFLLSACLIILLVLNILHILSWWEAAPIILTFFFLELFFQAEKKDYGKST